MSPAYDWRDMFKPTDSAVIATEVKRMSSEGLKPRDIADSLRISLGAVITVLHAQDDAPAAAPPWG